MSAPPCRLAVVTGGHPFDVLGFHDLVRCVCAGGVLADVQHLEEFASTPPEALAQYDAVLFYFFPLSGPVDGEHGMRPRTAIASLLAQGTGIIVLHHALLAYPEWELWDQVVGVGGRSRFTYHPGQQLRVGVASASHAITAGSTPWSMVDETYGMGEPPGTSTALLEVQHPLSMRTIAWAHQCGRSRVLCLQSGHDASSWSTPGFQRILRQGIRWACDAGTAACEAKAGSQLGVQPLR